MDCYPQHLDISEACSYLLSGPIKLMATKVNNQTNVSQRSFEFSTVTTPGSLIWRGAVNT
ncbi:hypothetical protein J6590_089868 [Homalodisca vitripennis]|nr:hypothetical protein J6590_089868 [Homalodisca vitripennis]